MAWVDWMRVALTPGAERDLTLAVEVEREEHAIGRGLRADLGMAPGTTRLGPPRESADSGERNPSSAVDEATGDKNFARVELMLMVAQRDM